MTTLNGDKRAVQPIYSVAMAAILVLFASFAIYMASGADWFGDYEQPVISTSPMLVVMDDAQLLFMPGSKYYKFPNRPVVVAPAVPAIVLPTAVPPKAQP